MDREPTEDQMRDAWRALARPEWGAYEQVKQAALHWARVRSRARLVASGVRIDAEETVLQKPAGQTLASSEHPAFWGSLREPKTQPLFDRKRAAAGEREDD
jgi:hypothetical protein